MRYATAQLYCFLFFTCSACLLNAQYKAEIMLFPHSQLSEIQSAQHADAIVFKAETLTANGSMKIESSSPEALLAFMQHEKDLGLIKTFFSLSKFPEIQDDFREVMYDVRKEEYILKQQDNGLGSE